ncbi:glycosyltransferase family 2 protein [Rickettsiales bacterium LUAb2]
MFVNKVSVIISCYNLGEYLEDAVNSVLNQSYQNFEIIIVNDGSTDQYTIELLQNYNKPKTTVYSIHNQGVSKARNFGIEKATGKYICCLDADDILHKDYLKSCIDVLDNDVQEKIGFVTTWVKYFGESDQEWLTSEYNPIRLLSENIVHVASVFRKKAWEAVGGYAINLRGYEDWNFWISIVSKGFLWEVISKSYFYYRVRNNSKVKTSNNNRFKLIDTIISNNKDYYVQNLNLLIIYCLQQIQQLQEEKDKLFNNLSQVISNKDEQIRHVQKILHKSFEYRIKTMIKKIVKKLKLF